jgi:hypothetical protein
VHFADDRDLRVDGSGQICDERRMHPTLARLLAIHERRASSRAKLLLGLFIGMGTLFLMAILPRALTPTFDPLLFSLLLLFGGAFPVLGLVMVRTVKTNTHRLRQLFERPLSIVWIYGERHSINGVPAARRVMVAAVDLDARCDAGPQAQVLGELSAALPHAMCGYGQTQADRYRAMVKQASAAPR